MEKDIEILEEFLKKFGEFNNLPHTDIIDSVAIEKILYEDICNAIENLINRIKELEEIEEEHRKENGKLQEKIKELEIKLEIEKVDNKYNQEEAFEEMIPKYKIKEKIEEVKNSKENYTFEKLTSEDIRRTIITNLQELLEE